ncbi:hypothetical protein GD1_48 [Paraglaciecola Antarctic GD virus 1]|nr:hypothetical protein GD1_48 [Paraglaciecola Antarctic GD virus 1]
MKTFSEFLGESGLSRIKSKIDAHATGAITAFRGGFTKSQNQQRNKKLLAMIMRKGYQVTTVKGSYIEDFGTDTAKEVGETSFFVVNPLDGNDKNALQADLIRFGKQFDQDSILSVPFKGKAVLIGTNNSEFPGMGNSVPVGTAGFGKSGEFFSRVNGRAFNFSENEVPLPTTQKGLWAMERIAEQSWEDIEV